MKLAGKTALVTGASLGIGRAAAYALAQEGADVAFNYLRSKDAADELTTEIKKLGRRVLAIRADMAEQAAVEEMVAKTAADLGKLDIFVSNAVYSDREPFYSGSLEGFKRTIDVSLLGAYYGLRASANVMIKQGHGGNVVIISSPHAHIPMPNSMAYNMSKAANDMMAKTAALELAPFRIRVNILHPGWTDTPGERKFFSEEALKAGGANLPWGRLGTSEEVARGVVFLADPASDYITGSTVSIDGGCQLPWWSRRGSGDF